VLSDRRGRLSRWFIALVLVAFVVIIFVNWTPALIALGVVIVLGGLGQLAGLWHPRKRE
jgi:Flp pilus assembly protein TadB